PEEYVAKKDISTPKLPPEIHRVADRQTSYDFVDTPAALRERYTRQLQAMTGIDRMVGQLRAKLTELGLAQNTVLIFTSDHGLFMGEYGLGGKAFCYEITTHVPLIIYNPIVPKRDRGKTSDALVQSIDLAPTMLSFAGIFTPLSYQGKDLNPLLAGNEKTVRDYLFTENLWSTHFGNPRCDAVQNEEWKYIRYYQNHNFSAREKIAVAREMGIPISAMLYKVHDHDIAVYRSYVEGPLGGEHPVYEELFYLKQDPREANNLASDPKYASVLQRMKETWEIAIREARGEGPPQVLRYTADSEAERGVTIEPK
ncbi:MAG: sulfatase/phosphatase domain-containing protein, partial [Bacteroidota bacterium]